MANDINLDIIEETAIYLEVYLLGSAANNVINESIEPDGSETQFTLAHLFKTATTQVYLNGLRQSLGDDYAEISNTDIEFVDAPYLTDTIVVDYEKSV